MIGVAFIDGDSVAEVVAAKTLLPASFSIVKSLLARFEQSRFSVRLSVVTWWLTEIPEDKDDDFGGKGNKTIYVVAYATSSRYEKDYLMSNWNDQKHTYDFKSKKYYKFVFFESKFRPYDKIVLYIVVYVLCILMCLYLFLYMCYMLLAWFVAVLLDDLGMMLWWF